MFHRSNAVLALAFLATAGMTSGCVATRKFVRNENSALSAKMDTKDQELERGIEASENQITELSGVTREHTQKIDTLDSGLKTTDEKASQALGVGQTAQTTANQASSNVSALDQKFQSRNHYIVLSEEVVPFKFDSAEIEDASTLASVAQQVKGNPDAILVLEGHTDTTGEETYNIQLGERRLEAVIRNLVVEQGVPMHQIHKMSFGEEKPIASNDTTEGRAQNRSVVVRIMGPGGSGGSMAAGQ
jgi:outer membrane protein OmpA-like peptidoglycan-associated protein